MWTDYNLITFRDIYFLKQWNVFDGQYYEGILSKINKIMANIFSPSHLGFLTSMTGGGGRAHAPTLAGGPGPTSWRRRRRTWTWRWRRRTRSTSIQGAGVIMNPSPAETEPES